MEKDDYPKGYFTGIAVKVGYAPSHVSTMIRPAVFSWDSAYSDASNTPVKMRKNILGVTLFGFGVF